MTDSVLPSPLILPGSERAVLSVTGPDRVRWLNGVVTCEVTEAASGRAVFGLLLSKQGKIQTDFLLVAGASELFLAVSHGTAAAAHAELERMLVMEDAELADRSADLDALVVVGSPPPAVPHALAQGTLARGGLVHQVAIVPRAEHERAAAELEAAGSGRATPEIWDALRLDHALGAFGVDYGPNDNPHEAGLEREAIAWSKGCYLGQEVVFMQDARGKLKRRLCPLRIDGGVPAPGAELTTPDGVPRGELTSVCATPFGARALGRVRAPSFEPGTRLFVAGFPAEILARPL